MTNIVNEVFNSWKGLLILWLNALAVFFAPVAVIAVLVGLATLLDMCFAVWMTRRTGGKVTSRKMRVGLVNKTFAYVFIILFVYAIDSFIIGHILSIFTTVEHLATKIFALILIGIEIWSIDESYIKATGKSFLGKIFKSIRNIHKLKDEIIRKQE